MATFRAMIALALAATGLAAPEELRITDMPGLAANLTFDQYSGYVEVDATLGDLCEYILSDKPKIANQPSVTPSKLCNLTTTSFFVRRHLRKELVFLVRGEPRKPFHRPAAPVAQRRARELVRGLRLLPRARPVRGCYLSGGGDCVVVVLLLPVVVTFSLMTSLIIDVFLCFLYIY